MMMLEMKAAPAGNRGLTPTLIRAGEEASMHPTQTQAERYPNSRSLVIRRSYGCRVRTIIWQDDEFRGLGRDAQLLWFYRVTHMCRAPFDVHAIADHMRANPVDIQLAADTLARTRFADVLSVWPYRRSPFAKGLRSEVYERDGHTCQHCGATSNLSLDHIHPFSLGGTEAVENLQTLCRPCNSRKGAKV